MKALSPVIIDILTKYMRLDIRYHLVKYLKQHMTAYSYLHAMMHNLCIVFGHIYKSMQECN